MVVDSLACPSSLVMYVKWRSVRRHRRVARKGWSGYGGFRIAAGGWCQSWLTLSVAPGFEKKKLIGKRNPPSYVRVLWYILSGRGYLTGFNFSRGRWD